MEISEARKEELKKKLKGACERYAQVFKVELSVPEVLEKLEELKAEERRRHFIERLGPVTELDCAYLIDFVRSENKKLELEARAKAELEKEAADGKDLEGSGEASEERREDEGRGKKKK